MTFPYVPSGGVIQQAVDQFRKALPPKIDATTLKKLGVAPSNEGYVINTMKFLRVADASNDRTKEGIEVFSKHEESEFQAALAALLEDKYSGLFDIRGNEAWSLDRDALISFFRGSDKTTAIVGARQAVTFTALAAMAGKRDTVVSRSASSGSAKPKNGKKVAKQVAPPATTVLEKPLTPSVNSGEKQNASDVALTVRIEINLPANGSQSTYDNIFKSIRENLLK